MNIKDKIKQIRSILKKAGMTQQRKKGKSSVKGVPFQKRGFTIYKSTRGNFVDFEFAPAPEGWFKKAQNILKKNNVDFTANKNNSSITINENIMKLKPKDIKKYNKLSKKKPVMVRVGSKWYTWSEGDPKYGVFLTTQSGRDVEFDFKQIDDIQEGVEKLTKSKLKEMIREELMKEDDFDMDDTMPLVRALNVLEYELGKLKHDKVQNWGKKYFRSQKALVTDIEKLTKIVRKMK